MNNGLGDLSRHVDSRNGPPKAVHSRVLTMPRSIPPWRGAAPMFAATSTTVKFDAFSTPEQRASAIAIDHSLTLFWALVERLQAAADQHQPIHQVEETIFRQLLTMGRSLLRAFLALSGDGDSGPTLPLPGDRPLDPPQVLPRLDEPRSRPYLSIFGETTIARVCYGQDRVEAVPLD